MAVYRSHYVSPDDGDDDVTPRRGRHAVRDDDHDDYGEPDPVRPRTRYTEPDYGDAGYGDADYAVASESAPRGGTVYGRPRQQDAWDAGNDDDGYNPAGYDRDGYNRAGYDRDGYDHDGYDRDGYDHDGYNHDGYNHDGYDRAGARHAHHEHGPYRDDYDDPPRGRRRAEYDDYDRYDDDPDDGHHRGRHDDWDDEPGYNPRRRRTDDDHDTRDRQKPRDVMSGVRAGVRGFGELLITFGLVVLLFAGYEVWGKSAQVDAAQNALDDRLENTWGGEKAPKEKPLPGDAIARLHIPRLDKRWVVVEGVKPADIKNAPGHYPDSAMPGKIGNFAVAGHRMPAVFWNLHKMQPGDKIFLEDRTYWYEYRVTEVKIVLPNAVEVVAPVPGRPGAKPTEAMLTITTCNPQWDNYERLVVHAKLAGEPKNKDEGRPPELAD